MKKCPYCSAELLDNAEFCLYCMRPLDKKHIIDHKLRKPRFKFAVIGVTVIILTIGIFSFITVRIGYRLKQRDILNNESISEAFLPNTGNFKLNGEITGNNYGSRNTENDKFSAVKNEENSKDTTTKYTEADSISTSVSSVSDANSSASSGNNSKSEKSEDSGSSVSGVVPSSDISEGQSANSSSGEQSQETLQIWLTRNVDGGVEITGIKTYNSTGHYEIPPQINGKNVVGIGQRAFKYEKTLKSIILPETITYIEELKNTFKFVQGTDAATFNNAFGIEFKGLDKSAIQSVTLNGETAQLEAGNAVPSIIVTKNARTAIGKTFELVIKLKENTVKDMEGIEYNPFIVENNDGSASKRKEVHLPKQTPTALGWNEGNINQYYVDGISGAYPFAIDIPVLNWKQVTESVAIGSKNGEYPTFRNWADSNGQTHTDWYNHK